MIKGLYAIVGSHANFSPSKMAEICLEGGASVIQLRMKNSKKEDVLKEGKKICDLKKKYSFIFIVNDDPQMALELDADGVHLGQNDLSFETARKILGVDKVIGISNHSIEDVKRSLTLSLYPSPLEGEGKFKKRYVLRKIKKGGLKAALLANMKSESILLSRF